MVLQSFGWSQPGLPEPPGLLEQSHNGLQKGALMTSDDLGHQHQHRLAATLLLTGIVFAAEVMGALTTRSLALLVDAAHMLTDVLVLSASTITAVLMRRKPDNTRTWGWARLEVITAATGALILFVVGIYALVEAGLRLFGTGGGTVHSVGLLLFFGILGLVANMASMVILRVYSRDNMNMRAAFLEVLNDALGSLSVVISAVVMLITGWSKFDALAGAVIAVLMVPRALKLLHTAVNVLLEETPEGLDLDEVRRHLQSVDHVVEVHDVHASTVSTGMPILTAHVVVERGLNMDQAAIILDQMQTCLREHFAVSIPHTTFQLEPEGHVFDKAGQLHS